VKARLQTFFAKKKEEEAAHRLAKEELCTAAESLANSGDWLAAANSLKELQAKWKTIGPTSRRDSEALWKRFRAACDQFFSRRDEDRKRRRAEWSANLARKESLCEKAEGLSSSTEWEATAAELRKMQIEWKAIGPVRRTQSERVWGRFRGACDKFFERYKVRDDLAHAQVMEEREADCRALEGLTEAPADLPTLIQQTFARARQKPLSAPSDETRFMERLQAARDRLVEAFPESFRGTELDPEANRTKREKLCERIESVAAEFESLEGTPLSTQDLARRLKEALAARTIGGASEAESRRKTLQEEAQAARSHWERLGSVVGEQGRALEKRFQAALARVPLAVARPHR